MASRTSTLRATFFAQPTETISPKKKPTHKLKLKAKDGAAQTVCGVGFKKEGGHIIIRLNPGIVLTHELLEKHLLTLFPVDA